MQGRTCLSRAKPPSTAAKERVPAAALEEQPTLRDTHPATAQSPRCPLLVCKSFVAAPHGVWVSVTHDVAIPVLATVLLTEAGHLADWLQQILPETFTLVFVNRLSRDEVLAFVFITTGLSPHDRIPSQLVGTSASCLGCLTCLF